MYSNFNAIEFELFRDKKNSGHRQNRLRKFQVLKVRRQQNCKANANPKT